MPAQAPANNTLTPSSASPTVPAKAPTISHFGLANGLEIVVIPDHRTPVVTHMLWYRNGSADDPQGKSGIAHFLEHLMFKGTAKYPVGVFSNTVAELGGQENAFTFYDFTAYFQRVAAQHLGRMMEFEADRMTGLVLSDEVVAPERDVVLEERRMRTDSDPASQLSEAVQASLYVHHPYGLPVIGWQHEIEGFSRADALAYYNRFYTPENAILVVAGDVEADKVKQLAEETYGRVPARGAAPTRLRPREPEPRAHRLVTLADPKVQQPNCSRVYLVPSYVTGERETAAALDVLAHLLGGGHTSVLYRRLVIEQKIAVTAGAYYMGHALDDTRFMLYAVPAEGIPLEAVDRAVDAVITEVVLKGVSEDDLARSKTRLIADAVYAQDSQFSLARWYGEALSTGQTVEDVRLWPERIEAVTSEAVKQAARLYLGKRRAVTGFLLPEATAQAA
ncbi:MAG: insulinase family protein [Methylobacteriaceae bacterium]|nr:insulinase family protein [Methylobacteriaceae bacterium]